MKTTEELFERARKRLEAKQRGLIPAPTSDLHASREAPPTSGRGLAARWSRALGYIGLFDPVNQEWHDLPVGDAPNWAKREATDRKRRRKKGRGEPLGSRGTAHPRGIRQHDEGLKVDLREESG